MNAARQLPLDLSFRSALGREDFLVAPCNEEAVAWLDKWPVWPSVAMVLHGPHGAGKTHLVNVWREQARASLIEGCDLTVEKVPDLLKDVSAVAVENAQEGNHWEALFHLYNLCKETGKTLLLTALEPPSRWNIDLADLDSRLRTAVSAALKTPEEDLMAALLLKQAADRRLIIGPEVFSYILPRLERNFTAVRDFVARLDAESLAAQRRITIPLAGDVLEALHREKE
ncbi:HdaA/DnaA family protein [Aestuariispira insulae]|uniref:DnaA regulatory inactivator Hda n=1 Tax=Aestuariispira insulae TaxID=1461337 RepID=A0A3D9HN39_9PROT|nr:DnaA/Hda family protein [Aestuariispira insulae]RED50878.1 DnaA regulatory inactivator Hda [Aestuariispira insulae]